MQQPDIGSLLIGLRAGLAESVLPALAKGPAQQQLHAALHLLGRLARTWDLVHPHLAADTADLEAVLGAHLGPEVLERHLKDAAPDFRTSYNDPLLAAVATRNLALHALLATLDADASPEIQALYRRMSARDSVLAGDAPPPRGDER